MNTLAERVDELIEQHGSIRKAARALEVDHAHLFRIKKGEKQPSDDLLRRMGLRRHVYYTRTGANSHQLREGACESK